MQKFQVEGYQAFIEKIDSLKDSGKQIYIMFSGSKDPTTGQSWCPDCVTAMPVVEKALTTIAEQDFYYIYVSVGPRDYWKDMNNEFRNDCRTKISSVPTLIKYGTQERLVESQCANPSLVEMIFE